MKKIMGLRNQRNTLWEQTKSFLEEHRSERGLVEAEAVEQYNKMAADVKALGDEIVRLEEQAALDAELAKATRKPVLSEPVTDTPKKDTNPVATDEYKGAFWDMMRGSVAPEVRNALSIGEDTEGGFTVPDEFERQLIHGLEENNIFRRMAHVIRTASGTRKIPIANDVMEASWIDEGEAIPETNTKFAQTTLSAYKLGTMIKVSNELLHDSAFDIAAYIADRFGVCMGNAEENAFINGTGVSADPTTTPSEPTGILTTLTTPSVKTANAVSISFDDVFKLYYALKAPYRAKANFLCNEATLLQLMLLKDKNDNYLWKPGLDIGKPDTILGHQIYTSTYMPAIEGVAANDAGKKVLLFGDFSYYWVADRTNRTMRRLNELYAMTDQVGFVGTQRVDGKLILPEAMKVLGMGANG